MEPPSGQCKGELSLQGSKPGHVKVQELGFVSSNFKAEIAGKVANGFSRRRMKSTGDKMDNNCELFTSDSVS